MRTSLVLIAVLCSSTVAFAQFNGAPDLISHQGLLADNNGDPVPDGTYNMEFSLYIVPSGGTEIWSETHNGGDAVPTVDGVFHVELGSISSLAEVPFDSLLYLGLSVNGAAELSPRTTLTAVPYALSLRNLRVIPQTEGHAPNMIGGHSANSVAPEYWGQTIGGGGGSSAPNTVLERLGTIAGGANNTVAAYAGAIGGGDVNTVAGGGSATIGGGRFNVADGTSSTVGGGQENHAAGFRSTIPGGWSNYAGGQYSFAAGSSARVRDNDDGTWVWSDRSEPDSTFESTADNQFLIKAAGGVGIGTNSPQNNAQLHLVHEHVYANDWGFVMSNDSAPAWRAGMRLSSDGYVEITNNADDFSPNLARLNSDGEWSAVSDRRLKTGIEPATGLLEAALEMEPVTYRFKNHGDSADRKLGLIAQDVETVVPSLVTGEDVLTLNYAGLSVVALGAIQEIHQQIQQKDQTIAELEKRLARLEELVMELSDRKAEAPPLSAR